jgi:hypothetical protein
MMLLISKPEMDGKRYGGERIGGVMSDREQSMGASEVPLKRREACSSFLCVPEGKSARRGW